MYKRFNSMVANRSAKKLSLYGGVCVMTSESQESDILLQRVPLGNVWRVGRRLGERLALLGMQSVSVPVWSSSIPCIEMNDPGQARQRIMTSRSFGLLTNNRQEIHQAIRQYAQRSAEKLRNQGSLARAVYVFLKANRHRPDLPQYSLGAIVELPYPSDDSRDILHAASQAFDAIYRPRYLFMKAMAAHSYKSIHAKGRRSSIDGLHGCLRPARAGR